MRRISDRVSVSTNGPGSAHAGRDLVEPSQEVPGHLGRLYVAAAKTERADVAVQDSCALHLAVADPLVLHEYRPALLAGVTKPTWVLDPLALG